MEQAPFNKDALSSNKKTHVGQYCLHEGYGQAHESMYRLSCQGYSREEEWGSLCYIRIYYILLQVVCACIWENMHKFIENHMSRTS